MRNVAVEFLKENNWIRMVLIAIPTQFFCVKIMEMLLGKGKKLGYLMAFMMTKMSVLCYLQSFGDNISQMGRISEIMIGAVSSVICCLLSFYIFDAEPVKILFAIAISELAASSAMMFSIAALNVLEKRTEGIFSWYVTFRPEDLAAWGLEQILFMIIFSVLTKFRILFQTFEIRHKRLIWCVYLVYFLIMQTSQVIGIATEEGIRRGIAIPCLIAGMGALTGIVRMLSEQKKKTETESQFLQLELSMMQSQYQAMQYQRAHIEESRRLIDRQMQEIVQKGKRSEKQTQVTEYLSDLEKAYQNIQAGIYCNEWTLDAILYVQTERARQQGINVTCKVQNYPKDQDGIQCMGKVLVELFGYAVAECGKIVDPGKKLVDVQIDVIASQAVVLFTCPAGKRTGDLKKKLNELTKEQEGNTEIEKDEGKIKICVTFAC